MLKPGNQFTLEEPSRWEEWFILDPRRLKPDNPELGLIRNGLRYSLLSLPQVVKHTLVQSQVFLKRLSVLGAKQIGGQNVLRKLKPTVISNWTRSCLVSWRKHWMQ